MISWKPFPLLLVLLLSTLPASAQEEQIRWPLHVAVGSYMTLQGSDLALTSYVLGAKQARELNPVLAPFSHNPVAFGAVKMGLATTTSYLLLRMGRQHPILATVLAGVGSGFYGGVLYRNARVYRHARGA